MSWSRAPRAAGGTGWGLLVDAALRPQEQVRAAGIRPEAPAPQPAHRNQRGRSDPAGSDARWFRGALRGAGRHGQGLPRV